MEVSVLNEKLKDFRENFRRPLEHGNTVFYEQGLPILLKYVYNYPDSYMMVELAIFHRAGHQYERARECFEKALALNPANPYAFNGLSFTYRYMNDFENALICMKKAMLYMNEDMSPAIYTDLADLYLLLGDYERALEALKQYEVKLNARPGLCHREKLANCYMRMGRLKEAEKIYIEIYRRDKRRAYTNFVSLYLRFGEREKAESLLCDWEREVRESDQSDAAKYRCGRGWLELLLGSPDAALKEFHRAVKKATADNMEEVLQEALFACIVCGDDNKGAKYSARLSDFLKNCRYYGRNIYFNKEKTLMWIEIMAAWYPVERDAAGTEEMLEKLFEREKQCGICHCCSTGVCRKTESLRILFLVRQGKRQEARELLRHDLELLPLDGYLLAIRRNVPGMGQPGGKDPI
jgi:tetratricopeptide (TPR) repeat protein